jgi:hypothetical protein
MLEWNLIMRRRRMVVELDWEELDLGLKIFVSVLYNAKNNAILLENNPTCEL